jgi:hypothetical protein
MHPVRSARHAVTPRPIRQISRAAYTVRNPLGAAENAVIGAALGGGRRSRRARPSRSAAVLSLGLSSGQTVSGSGVRADEAVQVHHRLAELMAVQRERFADARRPIVPDPAPVDPKAYWQAEWKRRKPETKFWQRQRRRDLQASISVAAQAWARSQNELAKASQRTEQEHPDRSWQALINGEPAAMEAALTAAFADNVATVITAQASGHNAHLVLFVPHISVLPKKKAHVTPTGRLSSKAWSKTELNEVYADLIGAHLLATYRETWAVAPSLTRVRVTGLFEREPGPFQLAFDVSGQRSEGEWNDDDWGTAILEQSRWGLNLVGKTREVTGWPNARANERANIIVKSANRLVRNAQHH